MESGNVLNPFACANVEILDLLVGIEVHLQGARRHNLVFIVKDMSKGAALKEYGVTPHRQWSFYSPLGLHRHRPDAAGKMRVIIICKGRVRNPKSLVAAISHVYKLMLQGAPRSKVLSHELLPELKFASVLRFGRAETVDER